ncbi:MAG: 23S rRNA (adenine(2503)-C(2))-methyltransferase RlmN [Armatimonadetes bacterium]|nr:23S rRNA (adenine(2503)-C(2))-methyltransferase RlmN [Armatimonadota bacterium]
MSSLIPLIDSLPAKNAPSASPPALLGMSTEEITDWNVSLGHPAFRGKQIAPWIYRKSARSFDAMTDLPKSLREDLAERTTVGRGEVIVNRDASDGTVKSLIQFRDGETVESVYLPWKSWDSVCVSTQAGCPAACAFCATGAMGFRRNLTAGEILDQVLVAGDRTAERREGDRDRLTNVVLMGMGEPLLNYAPTLKAVRLMNTEIGIGMRGITLSTVGIVPAIRRLAQERLQLTLSVSLHAPNQALRERIIPVAKTWDIDQLMDACREYASLTGRRVTYEYVMLAGVNDQPEHARELAALLEDQMAHVNLIPFNAGPTLSEFQTPSGNAMRRFEAVLKEAGVPVTLRTPRGRDIEAACGQLRQMLEKSNKGLVQISTRPGDWSAVKVPAE